MGSGPFGPFRLASVRTLISTRAAQRDTRCGPVLVSSQPLETGVSRTGAEGLGCGAHVSVAGPGLEGLSRASRACWMLLSFCQGPRRLEGPRLKVAGLRAGWRGPRRAAASAGVRVTGIYLYSVGLRTRYKVTCIISSLPAP